MADENTPVEMMERGLILYTHNDSDGSEQEWYSSDQMGNYYGGDNQHLMIVSDIDELNPTANNSIISGEGNILVYDNYNVSFTITFPGDDSRVDRANWVANTFYHIVRIGVVADVYSSPYTQTLYLKRAIPVHPEFTENKHVNGIQLKVTIELRGTWYYHDDQDLGDNTLHYINKGSNVITCTYDTPDDIYNHLRFVFENNEYLECQRLDSTDGHQFGQQIDWQYGAAFGTDGIAYDYYPGEVPEGPIGARSYINLGPSRNSDWMWGYYKDIAGNQQYGNPRLIRQLLYKSTRDGVDTTFTATTKDGRDVTNNCAVVNLHYLDFI